MSLGTTQKAPAVKRFICQPIIGTQSYLYNLFYSLASRKSSGWNQLQLRFSLMSSHIHPESRSIKLTRNFHMCTQMLRCEWLISINSHWQRAKSSCYQLTGISFTLIYLSDATTSHTLLFTSKNPKIVIKTPSQPNIMNCLIVGKSCQRWVSFTLGHKLHNPTDPNEQQASHLLIIKRLISMSHVGGRISGVWTKVEAQANDDAMTRGN